MIKRYAMVIKIKQEKVNEYKQLHSNPPQEVLDILKKHNVTNYSIHLHYDLLFGYLEYLGNNFDKDMKLIGQSKMTKDWWKLTNPCQTPLSTRKQGEWWALMEEVFYMK